MKVLFIQPPWGHVYGEFVAAAKVGNCYPPLGICYLSSVLKREGHSTKIIDAEIEDKSLNDILAETKNFNPDLIGFTCTTPLFSVAWKIAEKIKEKVDTPLLVGGPHVTVLPDNSVKPDGPFDYAICGEGERTIVNFVNALSNGNKNLSKVNGLIFKDESGRVIKNPPAPYENIDEIPWPDRKALMLEKYTWSIPGRGIERFSTLLTERGCPFSCTFCSAHTVFGKKIRYRDINDVVNEIEYLVYDLKITHLNLIDDTLTINRKRVIELCNEIMKRKINFTWEGWTRANTIDDELVRIMKKAGFVRVSFGIESGSPEILKSIKKEVKLPEIVNAFKIMKKYGIETRGSVMLGNAYETRKTVNETLRFIRDLKNCDQMFINIATPYPGTELYDQAVRGDGGIVLLEKDFSKYKRYGNAVIKVNDLLPEDLVRLQRKGFMMFYFTLGRIWYNFKRAGLRAFVKNAIAFSRSVIFKV